MKKLTFKKDNETGPYAAFHPDHTVIKLNGFEIGYMTGTPGKWYIRFAIIVKWPRKKDPAPFKWIRIKKKFESETIARAWVKDYNDKIQTDLNLYQFKE